MICMQRTFGHPVIVPPGNNARSASTGDRIGAQASAHVGHDVMHVCIGLGDHVFVHRHAAGLADAAEIVAFEIDQHDVLGAFLGMRHQLGGVAPILLGVPVARARAGDGPRRNLAALDAQQPLGRRRKDASCRGSCTLAANGAGFARRKRCVHARRHRRRSRSVSRQRPRQVGLVDVAGGDVFLRGAHAREEQLRRALRSSDASGSGAGMGPQTDAASACCRSRDQPRVRCEHRHSRETA